MHCKHKTLNKPKQDVRALPFRHGRFGAAASAQSRFGAGRLGATIIKIAKPWMGQGTRLL